MAGAGGPDADLLAISPTPARLGGSHFSLIKLDVTLTVGMSRPAQVEDDKTAASKTTNGRTPPRFTLEWLALVPTSSAFWSFCHGVLLDE